VKALLIAMAIGVILAIAAVVITVHYLAIW
jgi:hypothetical protein